MKKDLNKRLIELRWDNDSLWMEKFIEGVKEHREFIAERLDYLKAEKLAHENFFIVVNGWQKVLVVRYETDMVDEFVKSFNKRPLWAKYKAINGEEVTLVTESRIVA